MTFVDTNVYMYAVGKPHPLRDEARRFFVEVRAAREPLVTSAEVLQEFLHAYLPVRRLARLDAAMRLATDTAAEIWDLTAEDVRTAHTLIGSYPALGARDLVHLALCRRYEVSAVQTYDRALAAAF